MEPNPISPAPRPTLREELEKLLTDNTYYKAELSTCLEEDRYMDSLVEFVEKMAFHAHANGVRAGYESGLTEGRGRLELRGPG